MYINILCCEVKATRCFRGVVEFIVDEVFEERCGFIVSLSFEEFMVSGLGLRRLVCLVGSRSTLSEDLDSFDDAPELHTEHR